MRRVLVLGGTGFIGQHVVARLAAAGCRVTVPSRMPQRARPLLVLPRTVVLASSVHDDSALATLLARQDVVINLIGILQGRPGTFALGGQRYDVGPDFGRAHIALADRIVRLSTPGKRLLQVSALGTTAVAAPELPSRYLRSKAAAEAIVMNSALAWTIVRPSVVFGNGDRLLNTFATLQRYLPLVAMPSIDARFQPVWVDDLARALCACVVDPLADQTVGRAFDVGGPEVWRLGDLVTLAGRISGTPRTVLGIPAPLARLQAACFEFLPGPTPYSRDNLDSMTRDNVVAAGAATLWPLFGITPRAVEEVAPTYLGKVTTFYDVARRRAHR